MIFEVSLLYSLSLAPLWHVGIARIKLFDYLFVLGFVVAPAGTNNGHVLLLLV